MKRKWIIIRIETKSREFLSKMLITYSLIKEGYGVIITNKLGLDIKLFPKGIYMVNSLFPSTRKNIEKLKRNGHKIVFMDEEGLVYQNDQKCISRIDRESIKFMDQIYCNGKDQYRIMVKEFPDLADKIFITGNPRMNLLNESNINLVSDEVNRIKSKYGSFILVVSTFALVNHNDGLKDIEERCQYMKSLLKYLDVYDDNEFDEQFDYDNKQFTAMKKLVYRIQQEIGCKIIIRPHPSENINGWSEFANNIDNVEVIREGPLLSWIIASKMIIENNCTSAIESMFLHVPCLSYRPYKDDRFDQPLPNLLSKNISSSNEMIDEINKILAHPDSYDFEEYERIASDYVSFQKGNESVDEIVGRIKGLEVKPISYSSSIAIMYRLNPMRLFYIGKELAKRLLIYTPEPLQVMFSKNMKEKIVKLKQDDAKSKYGDINEREIKKTLIRIAKNRGDNQIDFYVKRIGDEIIIT